MELRTERRKLAEFHPEKAKALARRLHKKADTIEFVRKGIPIEPADIKIEEGERAAIRLITTPRLDRDGEILVPDGAVLDDFRQSPTVLYAHDYRSLPIGKDLWLKVTKRGILAKTQYANHAFAEDVFQCVRGGFLNSNSVGFIPVDWVKSDDRKKYDELRGILEKDYGVPLEESAQAKTIYTRWILLEHSDVPVPSNAQSLNLAVSKGDLLLSSDQLKKDLGIEEIIEPEPALETEIEPEPELEIELEVEPEDAVQEDENGDLAVTEKGGLTDEQIKEMFGDDAGDEDAEAGSTTDSRADETGQPKYGQPDMTLDLEPVYTQLEELVVGQGELKTYLITLQRTLETAMTRSEPTGDGNVLELTPEPERKAEPPSELDLTAVDAAVAKALRKALAPETLKKIVADAVDLQLKRLRGIVE